MQGATLMPSVYPCVYREHRGTGDFTPSALGLSLCIQGTFVLILVKLRDFRFIPVHTGNMRVISLVGWSNSVYPCAYREHWITCKYFIYVCGLSLCIQGTCARNKLKWCNRRFIPVHTGNIHPAFLIPVTKPVYPCAYREHNSHAHYLVCNFGLSLCIQGTCSFTCYLPN